MNSRLQTTLMLLPLLACLSGLHAAWNELDLRIAAPPNPALAAVEACRAASVPADTGDRSGRTQSPGWLQRQRAEAERCLRAALPGGLTTVARAESR